MESLNSWTRNVLVTDPISIILYSILAIIGILYVALNLRTGATYHARQVSTIEIIGGFYLTRSRIRALKAILATVWIMLFVVVVLYWLNLWRVNV
jgi:hypothetical protein